MNAPTRIMFDLETLSTSYNASILSIGAVVFGNLHESKAHVDYPREFYVRVNDPEGKIDLDTVLWWLRKSKTAQERLDDPTTPLTDLDEALDSFNNWCSMHLTGHPTMLFEQLRSGPKPNAEFWSRSPSFDEVILETAYERAECPFPIYRRWSRDCRTLEHLVGMPFEDSPKDDARHCALVDAQNQAIHALRCFAVLQEREQ